MFLQTWKKYLPVIILLMKRSEKGRAGIGYEFHRFSAGNRRQKNQAYFFKSSAK
jgi:hypothetical protein